MDKKTAKALKSIGVFNTKQAVNAAKVSQPTISRWVQRGLLNRIARGLYIHPAANVDFENLDYIVADRLFGPTAIIGGISALAYYGLIEQVPNQIWVMVPPNKRKKSNKKYRLIRTTIDLSKGIKNKKSFKISSIEKAILESMKYSTKIGSSIVISATRKAINEKLTSINKISKLADETNLKNVLEKYWESIIV